MRRESPHCPSPPHFLSGDILAEHSPGLVARIIRAGTWAPLLPRECRVNHVMICALHPDSGQLVEYESTMSLPESMPCMIRGEPIKGVQAHPIQERLDYAANRGNAVWHYRPRRPLGVGSAQTLMDFCYERLGTPYDYWGALRARGLGLGWFSHCLQDRLANWLPNRIAMGNLFCSEMAAAALQTVHRFNTTNPSKWSPASLCYNGWRVQGVFYDPIQVVPK